MIIRWMGILLLLAGTSAQAGWTSDPLRSLGTLPGNVVAWERSVRQGDRKVLLSGVTFSTADCEFRVLDNPPQARRSLTTALKAAGAVAGVNGGYFHPDDQPLGLVVTGGETLHPFERAKLLSGIFVVRKGKPALIRAENFSPTSSVQEALQAGPWLVEDGQAVSGLHGDRRARRTVVATTGRSHWTLISTSPVSLAELGEILARPDLLDDGRIEAALNLDGGSSTLLIALREGRPLLDIPSFGPVRNYLAIVPRER